MSIPKEFLRQDSIRAVCSIRNLKSDEVYLYKTDDAVKSYADERFRLDLGIHTNRRLQSEYTSLGLELFVIAIDEEAADGVSLDVLLEERKKWYLSRGKKLYNV